MLEIQEGFMIHSDRGIQYSCGKTRKIFSLNKKVTQSISRKVDCQDNAVAESFFRIIKYEMIHRYKFESMEQLYRYIKHYIDNWYNTKRLHSSLGYKTPIEKEAELKTINYRNVA